MSSVNKQTDSTSAQQGNANDSRLLDQVIESQPIPPGAGTTPLAESDLFKKLLLLAECIQKDPNTGDLILQNGKARAILKANGEVRLEGVKIIQVANENLTINAAYIELN
ncbi:MAG TPA: hypothetical protein VKZ53_23045 [Candidatus Angelobacter sp.]|nr:hypothetical protein [Candidatus Angelobacter sp.]